MSVMGWLGGMRCNGLAQLSIAWFASGCGPATGDTVSKTNAPPSSSDHEVSPEAGFTGATDSLSATGGDSAGSAEPVESTPEAPMPPDASVTSIAEPSTSSSELLEPPSTDDAPSPVQDAGALDAAPFIGDGRWWLVGFEDPIAIVLSGTPGEQGALSGITCLGGIVDDTARCNSLAGSFDGRDLEFSVPAFPEQPYAARTRLSEDGQRMTGDVTNASGDGSTWSTTWLRIPDHEVRIGQYEGDQWPALPARSSFTLVEAQDGGDEFLMGRSYDLIVIERQLIAGGFGSFSHTEMVLPQNEDDPLIVGPVAPTWDHLPIQLVITLEDDTATEIIAMTASAHSYRFVLLQGDGG